MDQVAPDQYAKLLHEQAHITSDLSASVSEIIPIGPLSKNNLNEPVVHHSPTLRRASYRSHFSDRPLLVGYVSSELHMPVYQAVLVIVDIPRLRLLKMDRQLLVPMGRCIL